MLKVKRHKLFIKELRNAKLSDQHFSKYIAVNIFLAKVAMEKGIPFDLTLPSDELTSRLKNLEANTNTQTYKTSDALFDDLGI